MKKQYSIYDRQKMKISIHAHRKPWKEFCVDRKQFPLGDTKT